MSSGIPGGVTRTGTAAANNGAADSTVIAAPGANKLLRLVSGIITVTVAAVGGGGLVALEDGVAGTRILQANADTLKEIPFNFGPKGIPLTSNTLLNLTVDTAATTQATANVTALTYEVG